MHEKTDQLSADVTDVRHDTHFLIPRVLDTDPPLRLRPLGMRQIQRQCHCSISKPALDLRSKSGQPLHVWHHWRRLAAWRKRELVLQSVAATHTEIDTPQIAMATASNKPVNFRGTPNQITTEQWHRTKRFYHHVDRLFHQGQGSASYRFKGSERNDQSQAWFGTSSRTAYAELCCVECIVEPLIQIYEHKVTMICIVHCAVVPSFPQSLLAVIHPHMDSFTVLQVVSTTSPSRSRNKSSADRIMGSSTTIYTCMGS